MIPPPTGPPRSLIKIACQRPFADRTAQRPGYGDGSAFWKRIERVYPAGTARYWSVGENLLWSSPDIDAQGALQMWIASPEHKANLLTARWREIGISAVHVAAAPGTYRGLDVTIVTTDFGVRH